jgi:hypothetical protein
MTTPSRTPRILIVTPEVTYLPNGMGAPSSPHHKGAEHHQEWNA